MKTTLSNTGAAQATSPFSAPESSERKSTGTIELRKRLEDAEIREQQFKERYQSLNQMLSTRQGEWKVKSDQGNRVEVKARELLIQQLRQAEDTNSALTLQFNELYHYCESLYEDAENRRKVAEKALSEQQSVMVAHEAKISQVKVENQSLLEQISNLKQIIDQQSVEKNHSLTVLERGSEYLHSTMRSLNDFIMSFQNYLDSLEKHGITPISQRTGKLFIEHWKIQRENMEKVSTSLAELLD